MIYLQGVTGLNGIFTRVWWSGGKRALTPGNTGYFFFS